MSTAMPLNRPQRRALRHAVTRELVWGHRAVARELRGWRERARAIPDAALRRDALQAIDAKRGHTDGAALFWTLASARCPALLRTLVAYDVIYDYLDEVGERAASHAGVDGLVLHEALVEAVDPERPQADWYRGLPWHDDGGYLSCLVDACRSGCGALPGFEAVRALAKGEARRFSVLALNHEAVPARRDAALQTWAVQEFGDDVEPAWYELTAAASHCAPVLALLALAAESDATTDRARAICDAYVPWFGAAGTMLDSYVDQAEDRASGAHSYVGHYPSHELAVERLCESVERSAERLLALPNGERHAVLLGCMVAMYLSKTSAWSPELRAGTLRICRSGGALTMLLLPVLRTWRICKRQTRAT